MDNVPAPSPIASDRPLLPTGSDGGQPCVPGAAGRPLSSIPSPHLHLIYGDRPAWNSAEAYESECVEDMLGQNPPTWAELGLYTVGVLGLMIFCMALDAGWFK